MQQKWTLLAANVSFLEVFHTKCQRNILQIPDLMVRIRPQFRSRSMNLSAPVVGSDHQTVQCALWSRSQAFQ